MCLSTDKLKFLDMTNYIAPGFSYHKYLKAYGCKIIKGFFPYEYMNCLERLDDTALPPKEAFFSQMKNEGISDEERRIKIFIISDIDPNGCRPNVATSIRTRTCAVKSPIVRGSVTRRAVRRARRTTRGHRVCSRSSGPVTGSWGCAARRTIVSEPPTSTAPKD